MDNVRLKSRSNISILRQQYAILGLILCMVSCTERNKQVLNSAEQISTPIILHNTLLSELPANSKPLKILLDTMPKPEFKQLQGAISGFGKSIVPGTHFFIDKITAQPIPEDAQGRGLFTTYTTDDGLALDQINCSFKDRNGNLWFGTNGGGVSEYNGKTCTNYSKQQGLASNFVWCILEDKKGNLWFGTDGNGVSKFDGRVFTNYASVDGLAGDLVFSINEDSKGNLWFGTFKGGVSKYDGKKFTNYSTADGLSNNSVRDVIEDRHGDMWFATIGGGASKFDGKHFTSYNTSNGLSGDTVQSLHQDRKGNIWFGTFGGGLCKYDGKNFTTYTKAQGLANNNVCTVTEDTKGNIWVGTYSSGVSKLEGQRFTNYSSFQGLENNNVRCITEDNSGNIWVGTFGGGVSKFEGSSFSNFTIDQGLPNNVIFSITEDNSGDLWFGTSRAGVCKYDRKSFTVINAAHGLANGFIYSTAKDTKGNLWFGTFEGGVIKFDGKRFTNYTTEQGLAGNTVFSIKEDKSGNLWFGTSGGGVSKFDGKSFTNFTKAQGLADNEVFCITEDEKGNFWFGTSGGGISKFDGKGFTNLTIAQGLSDNMVWAITEDKANNIWVGTQQGLSLLPQKDVAMLQGIKATDTTLQGTLFQTFTKKDGLPDNNVTQIVQDNDQKLYIGTNLGICELIPGAASATPEKQWHTGKVFNSNTGYPVKDVNGGSGAMFKDSRGIIWIGTGSDKTGLVRFDPKAEISNVEKPPVLVIESIKINQENLVWNDLDTTYSNQVNNSKNTPPNIIEEINAFGRPLSSAERSTLLNKFGDIQFKGIGSWYPVPEKLVLPHNKNSISFDFNAIETGKNNLVKYQYILEGYDKNWSPPGYKNTATFGNIYEGSYTFKLRAQSPEGVWGQPVIYAFKVLPPWYRTWWMYLLYAIVIVAVIYIIFRWNHQRIIQQKKVLEFKVAYATTQMREEKENAEAQKKIAEETLVELEAAQAQLIQSEKMASLGELTAGIAHEIQNPLNFVNNFSEVSKELLDEMKTELDSGHVDEAKEIANDVIQNLEKINHHGKRADAIVKGMLQHSQSSMGVKEPTNINRLANEYLRIAYQGILSKDLKDDAHKEFKATLKTDFDEGIGHVSIIPQDIGRVLLNLYNNAFYAVNEKKKATKENYEPTVTLSTKKLDDKILIIVKDNGNGIPKKIVDKIFQPFFTTKPTGQGTGLGLSLSYDIVKAHGGEIRAESKEGEGSEFVILLPA